MLTLLQRNKKPLAGSWHNERQEENPCVGRRLFGGCVDIAKGKSTVRSIDLARHMGFSKPSISHAVGVLQDGGFLVRDKDGFLHLTDLGREIAEKIYERHQFFTKQFIAAGVDEVTAEQDACRIEHAISDTSFRKLKEKAGGSITDHKAQSDIGI